VFKIYKKEKNRAVKKKAAAALLKTSNAKALNRIFKHCEKDFFKPGNLLELVELCGNTRSQAAFPHLERLYFKRVLFNTKKRDDLCAAVLTSAARIKTEEALKLVRLGLQDKSRRVRETSEIILKLNE
jgi:hypothetical protein